MTDFQSETTVGKFRTSASTLYYQTLPCQSAGALIRDNTVNANVEQFSTTHNLLIELFSVTQDSSSSESEGDGEITLSFQQEIHDTSELNPYEVTRKPRRRKQRDKKEKTERKDRQKDEEQDESG